MIIKNYEIEQFGRFLFNLTLKPTPSRMRTRFVKILQSRLDVINDEKQQLINEYAKKDEDGNIIFEIDPEDNQEKLKIENVKEYNQEIINLMGEDFIIVEAADNLDLLKHIKAIVLNCDLEFSGEDAMTFDRWCEIVEDI